jgi:hypothetical protein
MPRQTATQPATPPAYPAMRASYQESACSNRPSSDRSSPLPKR